MNNSIFSIDPGTLLSDRSDQSWLLDLYRKYKEELIEFCNEMITVRSRMFNEGYSADFSDRESEVLYLMIRELKPDVIVEMSPCCGYSTNYILAALTANKKGHLYSYEIQETWKDRPMADVIYGNLNRFCDTSRLTLKIGDVMKAEIPAADFLFIDSCHEAYFAAWYFSHLIEKAKMVFIHDILIFDKPYRCVVPKATFLGIKESYYVLETLGLNHEKLFSIAAFNHSMPQDLKQSLPVRYLGAPERSILVKGHQQSELAKKLHHTQPLIEELKKLIVIGDREGALKKIQTIFEGDFPLFSQLEAIALLPQLSYRYPFYYKIFPEMKIQYDRLTVSELVVLCEIALNSCNFDFLRKVVRQSSYSKIYSRTRKYIGEGYLRMAQIGFFRRMKNLKPRIAKFAKYFSLLKNI